MYKKMDESGAKLLCYLDLFNLDTSELSELTGFKKMDIINVLRGNTFNRITGILKVDDLSADEIITAVLLLQEGNSYRKVAEVLGIDDNKIRHIKGYLRYREENRCLVN